MMARFSQLHALTIIIALLGTSATGKALDEHGMTAEDRAAMERINSQFESDESEQASADEKRATEKYRKVRAAREAFKEARSAAERAATFGWECRVLLEGGGYDLGPCDQFSRASRQVSRTGNRLMKALDAEGVSEADLPDGAMSELNGYLRLVMETQAAIQSMAQGK